MTWGFGFISQRNGDAEVFVQHSTISGSDQKSLTEGRRGHVRHEDGTEGSIGDGYSVGLGAQICRHCTVRHCAHDPAGKRGFIGRGPRTNSPARRSASPRHPFCRAARRILSVIQQWPISEVNLLIPANAQTIDLAGVFIPCSPQCSPEPMAIFGGGAVSVPTSHHAGTCP